MQNPLAMVAVVVVLLVTLVVIAVMMQFVGLYARALLSGAPVTMLSIIGMRLRRVDAPAVINAWILARRARVDVTLTDLEAHVLSGGDVAHVMEAVIAAKQMGKELDWKQAAAMDLAKRDVVEFVASGAHQRGQDWLTAPVRRRPVI